MSDRRPPWRHEATLLVLAGLVWLGWGRGEGAVSYALAAIPGLLLVGGGLAELLWPGDARPRHFAALGAFAGGPVGLLAMLWHGPLGGLALVAMSLLAALVLGRLVLRLQERFDDVPEPPRGARCALEVAVDEAVLAQMTLSAPPRALRGDGERVAAEVHETLAFFRDRGWNEKPADYHRTPPLLEQVTLRPRRARGIDFEHLTFESGYEPHEGEPGRDRYLAYTPCRTGHAWVLRHPGAAGAERPWLVCVHGYQMGTPLVDFGAFRPAWLHAELGLNLLLPVLPMHGPRRIRRVSGDGFLSGELVDTVHALAQIGWDLRRLLSWLRAQGAARIGVYGLSLGGYSTALLASLDGDLACAVAGIPATDFARLSWKHGPPDSLRRAEEHGVGIGEIRDLKKVVSPLALTPQVPRERRFVFGGTADQLVPPDLVRDLWWHWDRPAIHWYPGAHCTFGLHRPVRRFVAEAFRASGLTATADPGSQATGASAAV